MTATLLFPVFPTGFFIAFLRWNDKEKPHPLRAWDVG